MRVHSSSHYSVLVHVIFGHKAFKVKQDIAATKWIVMKISGAPKSSPWIIEQAIRPTMLYVGRRTYHFTSPAAECKYQIEMSRQIVLLSLAIEQLSRSTFDVPYFVSKSNTYFTVSHS